MFKTKFKELFGFQNCLKNNRCFEQQISGRIADDAGAMQWLINFFYDRQEGKCGLLEAPCNAGKTYALIKVLRSYAREHAVIISVPTRTQVKQMSKEYHIESFMGKDEFFDVTDKLVVCVSDKVEQAYRYFWSHGYRNNIDLIIDEAHASVATDESYRAESVKRNRDTMRFVLKEHGNVLMVSATPDPLGWVHFTDILRVTTTWKNIPQIQVINYKPNSNCRAHEYITAAVAKLLETTERAVVYCCDKDWIMQAMYSLESQGVVCASLFRENAELCTTGADGSQYRANIMAESILDRSVLPVEDREGRPIRVYFTTNIVNTGVNITGYSDGQVHDTVPVCFITKAAHFNSDSIVQFMNRLRFPCKSGFLVMPEYHMDPDQQVSEKNKSIYRVFESEYGKSTNRLIPEFQATHNLIARTGINDAVMLISDGDKDDVTAAYCYQSDMNCARNSDYLYAYEKQQKSLFVDRENMVTYLSLSAGIPCSVCSEVITVCGSGITKEQRQLEFERKTLDIRKIAEAICLSGAKEQVREAVVNNTVLPKDIAMLAANNGQAFKSVAMELSMGCAPEEISRFYATASKREADERAFTMKKEYLIKNTDAMKAIIAPDTIKAKLCYNNTTAQNNALKFIEGSNLAKYNRMLIDCGFTEAETRERIAACTSEYNAGKMLHKLIVLRRQGIIRTAPYCIAGAKMRVQEIITNAANKMRSEGRNIVTRSDIVGWTMAAQKELKRMYTAPLPMMREIISMLEIVYGAEITGQDEFGYDMWQLHEERYYRMLISEFIAA